MGDGYLRRLAESLLKDGREIENHLGQELISYKYIHEHHNRLEGVLRQAHKGLRGYIKLMEGYLEHGAHDDKEKEELEETISDLTELFTLIKSAYHDFLRMGCLNVSEEVKGMLPAIKQLRALAGSIGAKKEEKELKELWEEEDLLEEEMDALTRAARDIFTTAEDVNRFNNTDIDDIGNVKDDVEWAKQLLVSLRSNYKIVSKMLGKVDRHLKQALSAGEHAAGTNKRLHELLMKYAQAKPEIYGERTRASEKLKEFIRREL
ncbi:hypothetical protein JXA12_03885 [Candidatus Woesearchaeota archaeon]|nr:hypothetical protein [Candidatus Woesearchaeota archaeon]